MWEKEIFNQKWKEKKTKQNKNKKVNKKGMKIKEKGINKLIKIIMEEIILMISYYNTMKTRNNGKSEHVENK